MNEDTTTSDSKRQMISPDVNIVQELFDDIRNYLNFKNIKVLEGVTALIVLMITESLDAGLSKSTVLCNISNLWELNDPNNNHPGRSMSPSIKY